MAVVVNGSLKLIASDSEETTCFFGRLARLDVNDGEELSKFLGEYKFRQVSVSRQAKDREMLVAGRDAEETAIFDDFTLDVWKKYYVDEDVVQIGIFQGTFSLPTEVRVTEFSFNVQFEEWDGQTVF